MNAQMVIFDLAGHRLALPADAVRECLPLPTLWRRPGLPDAVAGFFSLGGATLPVIDLAVLLGLRPPTQINETPDDRAQQDGLYRPLLHVGDVTFLVDRLDDVAAPDAPSSDRPDVDPWQHGCVTQHLLATGRPVALLDPSRLLMADEQDRLAILTRDAAARARSWTVPADPQALL